MAAIDPEIEVAVTEAGEAGAVVIHPPVLAHAHDRETSKPKSNKPSKRHCLPVLLKHSGAVKNQAVGLDPRESVC